MAYRPQRDYMSIRDTIPFICVRLYPARTRYYWLHVQVPSCLYTRVKIPASMSEYSTACTCPACTTCTYDCLLRVGSSDYARGVRDAVSRQDSV
jgi:hypothetical protein